MITNLLLAKRRRASPCWCGAKAQEPCRDTDGRPAYGSTHETRGKENEVPAATNIQGEKS